MDSPKRSVVAKVLLGLSVLTGAAFAQSTTGRLAKTIEGYNTVQVPGTVSPRAASQFDAGRVNSGTRLEGVTMYFAPTPAQQQDLNLLVREQQTPGSAYYHKWLTPAQFAARFGLSNSDIARVTTWLQNQGFTVERVANSRMSITFSGSVSQVESAFQTELHNYTQNGVTHFANSTPVSVPAELNGMVRSIGNLNNFRPQPHVRLHNGSAKPAFTSSQSGDHYLTPGDVATIYDINAAYSAGYTGLGQSIAILGQSAVELSDISAFQTAAGVPARAPSLVLVPDTGDSELVEGDETESDLDLEYSGSIAQNADIYFVYTGNSKGNDGVFTSLQYAVDTDIAPIISLSYGVCEPDLGQANYQTLEAILQEGAVQGQSIIVSSGDTGSTACYADLTPTTKTVTTDEEQLAVSYPASSAYVTALGGTEFPSAEVATTNSTYWAGANGNDDVVSTALSYIPEEVWNDDSATEGSEYGAYYALSSGGGGTSQFVTRPAWQSGVPGITSGSNRMVPDISLDSSNYNAPYLFCSSDPSAWNSGQKSSCTSGFRDENTQDLTAAGGTSFAAPIFAGMLAIINQKTNSTGQGLINSTLYTLAGDSATYASVFHDITSGSNACTAGTTYCSTAGAGSYSAAPGYDEASGLGSVDLNNLMTAWPVSTSTGSALEATVTSLSTATADPSSGAADTITISVASSSTSITAVPTGTITISVDGKAQTPSLTLSSGSASYSFSSTTAGEHVIVASYSGDDTFAASSSTTTVDVGATSSGGVGTLAVSATNISVAQGSSGSSSVTVTSGNSYIGTVNFQLSTTDTSIENDSCYEINSVPVSANATATTTLTIYTSQTACSAASNGKASHRHAFVKKGSSTAKLVVPAAPWRSALSIGSAFSIAGVCFLGFSRRRRKLWMLMMLLPVIGILGFASGCGSSSKSTTTTTTTPTSTNVAAGSYTLTLDAADSNNSAINATTTFTLTVTN